MKQLNDQDRLLLSSLSDIERVLDNVDLSTNQIEKIWGSFKTIRDIVYGVKEETITGVITGPKLQSENSTILETQTNK
jgi:hypothetical protein